MHRRERTRRLIELGGLVEKSGLRELLGEDDPDASLLGALLAVKAQLAGGTGCGTAESTTPDDVLALWRRRGRRALRDALDDNELTSRGY